jgi:Flp pilus assembly protein TadD
MQLRYWQNNFTLFEHTIAVTEKNPLIHYGYGKALLKNGRIEEATMHFNEILRLMPTRFEAYNGLGVVFIRQGKIGEAIACFVKSLSIEPNQPVIYHNLGLVYLAIGKYEEAIQNFKEALRLKPDFREAGHHMAMALKLREEAKTNEAIRKKEKEP